MTKGPNTFVPERLLTDEVLGQYHQLRKDYKAELDDLRERYWQTVRRHRRRGASPETYEDLEEMRDEEVARLTQEFQASVRRLLEWFLRGNPSCVKSQPPEDSPLLDETSDV